jgi:uncharacterized protein (TIGR02145 family)
MKERNRFHLLILISFGIVLCSIFIAGCKKSSDTTTQESSATPVLTTSSITGINSTVATCGGTITSDGGAAVTARGVCWSTAQNPTVADNKTSDGNGTGSFTSRLQGLSPATPYYVRAYATNSAGTAYGNSVTFTTLDVEPGTVLDYDGNVYHTVTIGTQIWLVENLKVTHYRNGDAITTPGKDMKALKNTLIEGEYWNYDNKDSLGKIYGRLYNYYAVVDPRFIAPLGWHVASDSDWFVLANYLGADSIVAGKLKETGTAHWFSPNTGATNSSGFTALPGGSWNPLTSNFGFIGLAGSFWTSTATGPYYAMGRSLWYNTGYIYRGDSNKVMGWSVRCLKGD